MKWPNLSVGTAAHPRVSLGFFKAIKTRIVPYQTFEDGHRNGIRLLCRKLGFKSNCCHLSFKMLSLFPNTAGKKTSPPQKNNLLIFHTGHTLAGAPYWISFCHSWPVLTNFRLKKHTDAQSS